MPTPEKPAADKAAPEKTAQFFDRYAQDFTAIYGNSNTPLNSVVNRLFRHSMKQRYELTVDGCAPIAGRSVLDIGSGPGHYSVELARRGAARVLGLDFADGMLDIARARATEAGVGDRCRFERGDFLITEFPEPFDYVIAMGFMDYIEDPRRMIEKAIAVTRVRAFFSFPTESGFLAWQRRQRYKSRCDLYLYSEAKVRGLFEGLGVSIALTDLKRDLVVAASKP